MLYVSIGGKPILSYFGDVTAGKGCKIIKILKLVLAFCVENFFSFFIVSKYMLQTNYNLPQKKNSFKLTFLKSQKITPSVDGYEMPPSVDEISFS